VGSIDLAEAVAISSEISTFVSVILTSSAWLPRNTPSDSRTNSVQRQDSRLIFPPAADPTQLSDVSIEAAQTVRDAVPSVP